jgi:hypothetical protein
MENTSCGGFSAPPPPPHTAWTTQQPVSKILDSSGLAAIFARHEPARLGIWCILQLKVQVVHHANLDALNLSIAVEWDH